jgi:hypothetical protein
VLGHGDRSAHTATSSGPTSSVPPMLNMSTRPFNSPTKPTPPSLPQASPTRHSVSRQPSQSPSSPSKPPTWTPSLSRQGLFTETHVPSRPVSSGGLQSFGPASEAFIERNGLGDRTHRQLQELFKNTLASKWRQTIQTWFNSYDEDTVSYLTDGLYQAMCRDVNAVDEY